MKIEKVNDNQIRCTLTKADLADRELKLSEIAYGTEKAKNLFRDMMQQAAIKFGFEADNIPLMIEAIPLNADCIVLIITKVEDPEELDTRFSRFAPDSEETDEDFDSGLDYDDTIVHSTDDVMDLFKKIKKEASDILEKAAQKTQPAKEEEQNEEPAFASKIFSFDSMAAVIRPSVALKGVYDDKNSLYKDSKSGRYMLVLNKTDSPTENFNKACNILSEYGKLERLLPTSEYYFKEHFDCVIEDDAIQSLSKVL
ncbi:MAG: adaptor protein MecA [Lachnospiraceae bacterium]|nr:adaptor protein MecA [Lachnospiraceae bacterium]